MNRAFVAGMTATLCVAAGAAGLAWWFAHSSDRGQELRRDQAPSGATAPADAPSTTDAPVQIGSLFQSFEGGAPSAIAATWPRFRGAAFDNIVHHSPPLVSRFAGTNGPALLWSIALGEGYAGPAVANGRVYLLDYDEQTPGDMLRCFSLDDGRELWRRGYVLRVKRNHGMSRTVPAVTADAVVTMGPRCQVMCVDALTGALRWGIDLVSEYGAQEPMWYAAQCPLIDDGLAVLAPGGSALMIGVDCRSGQVAWRTPNPRGWQMSHSSIVPAEIAGRRMYVYAAIGGLVGVAADEPQRGAVLWETAAWNHAVVAPTPVPLPGGRIFVTAGYGVGSQMFQVTESNGAFAVTSLFTLDRKVFACEQHTPVYHHDRLFGILPADAGPLKQQLVCLRLDGSVAWTSGATQRFGLGPFLVADDKLLILSDDGTLTLAGASPDAYQPLAEARVLFGKEAWAPMAMADGRLLARDSQRLVCLDLRNSKEGN